MILLLLQDLTTPGTKEIADLTQQFGLAAAVTIAVIATGLLVFVFFVVNIVNQLKAQTTAITDVGKGVAVLLDRKSGGN